MKGAFYDDFSSLRVQDLAVVKSSKMLITKTKIEFTAVRPGSLTPDGADSSLRFDEDRLKLLDVVVLQKAKGLVLISLHDCPQQ